MARCSGLVWGVVRLERGSGLLWGVLMGVRLWRPSGLAAGVGIGVVEAEACLLRGSGLGVRAVRARSRAARARARGEEGSSGFPVRGWRKVWGVGEGDRTGAGGGSSPRSSMEWL